MELAISIIGANGRIKASRHGIGEVTLLYTAEYEVGDFICLSSDIPGHVLVKLEDTLNEAFGYLADEFHLAVPFGKERLSYPLKSFSGDSHLLWARDADREEIYAYRNLALNPSDSTINKGLYPHVSTNMESQDYPAFAARNAIDGCFACGSCGSWPYQSWGVLQSAGAELLLEFGRDVTIHYLIFTVQTSDQSKSRWRKCIVWFSNGTSIRPRFLCPGRRQKICVLPQNVCWLKVGRLIQDGDVDSPLPVLAQLEVWGTGPKYF